MARINIVNADNKIDATPQRAYFKLKQTGGPKGEKGDTGAQGPQGATGPQGASASVVVNSTTTLPAGSDATVENIGTPQNVKLNFGIPTGPQGPQGEQGPQGAQGPQGLKGDTGAKGADGAAAKVTVGNTNTGAAGTNASVENTGSETFAVLNFTIPRGDKGETGPMPDIAQTTGQATDEVMSQKATTDALATKQNTLTAGTGITIASDTVSADTAVLATKADLNDYAPQATTYTKTETDALLAPKLETDVVAFLPATGEEGKLYLTPKNYTRQTATGNPITATISDGAGTLEAFQLDGDTFQQTYTGKNLFRNLGQDTSFRGVEYTVNQDGTVNIHGKATGGEASFSQSVPLAESLIENGATYTWWATKTIPDGLEIRVGSYNGSTWVAHVFAPGDRILSSDLQTLTKAANIQSNVTQLVFQYCVLNGRTVDIDGIGAMLEAGSTATTYEPFVGGTASPNPDYPQTIQTVTGEQMVEVQGKNLFDKSTEESGWLNNTGGIYQPTSTSDKTSAYIPATPNTAYTLSSPGYYLKIAQYDSSETFIKLDTTGDNIPSNTITTEANTAYIRISYGNAQNQPNVMLERGSAATTYAPYSKQTLPINLGSIELCKLGTYQDYIWKDGEDWKVHKATSGNMTLNGSEDGWSKDNNGRFNLSDYAPSPASGSADNNPILSNRFISRFSFDDLSVFLSGTNELVCFIYTSASTLTAWKAWLSSNNTTVCYARATPTDTTITDATLIAQLEAIRTAALEDGTNTIANSTAGSNLAGDMEITYYGYNPTNRYDKFIWLDLNNNYEQIGE